MKVNRDVLNPLGNKQQYLNAKVLTCFSGSNRTRSAPKSTEGALPGDSYPSREKRAIALQMSLSESNAPSPR